MFLPKRECCWSISWFFSCSNVRKGRSTVGVEFAYLGFRCSLGSVLEPKSPLYSMAMVRIGFAGFMVLMILRYESRCDTLKLEGVNDNRLTLMVASHSTWCLPSLACPSDGRRRSKEAADLLCAMWWKLSIMVDSIQSATRVERTTCCRDKGCRWEKG